MLEDNAGQGLDETSYPVDVRLDSGWGQLTSMLEPEEGQPPEPPPKWSSNHHQVSRSRARNVVIFGESGSGKSSVINAIAGQELSETSGDAAGCTFRYQCYNVNLAGQTFRLFDTAGLDEAAQGTVPPAKAEENLKSLLRELMSTSDGIGLLVYCVRSTRLRRALIKNYNIFYSAICRKKVPIVVVVTGLENHAYTMDSWWDTNWNEFRIHGMHFEDHACVTTLRKDLDIPDVFTQRITESSETLRMLIVNNCSEWAIDDSWFRLSFADVRNMISDRRSERTLPPTLIICDSTQKDEVEIAYCIKGTVQTCVAHIGGVVYRVHRVPQPEFDPKSTSNVEGRPEADLLVYYACEDEPSAARQKFKIFCAAYRGNMVPVIVVVKGLNDSKDAHRWVEEHIAERGAGRPFSTFAPARDLEDNSAKRAAEQELQELIQSSCLIRSEGRGGGTQKSGFVKLFGRWL
ncbi:hypothetical protein K503DRAFT_725889 [Rhizopogon vinicolor AM-OR11-026]|uniref:G domain-containing protein n=1 Tax=Rhizopogon vinicolor AM-OR11-026 TaxID=1314800 RepID=A0A1B7MLB6_9AGAM|nr:hypothetical protein K503DRAFT_725889 [Rhizopogon vinicolor AM-OR11-026]